MTITKDPGAGGTGTSETVHNGKLDGPKQSIAPLTAQDVRPFRTIGELVADIVAHMAESQSLTTKSFDPKSCR